MDIKHVEGTAKAKIFLYTLSTCGWCRKLKTFLNDEGLAYDYVDVDLETGAEKSKALELVRQCNPNVSFPTAVIDDDQCVVGYQLERLKKLVGI